MLGIAEGFAPAVDYQANAGDEDQARHPAKYEQNRLRIAPVIIKSRRYKPGIGNQQVECSTKHGARLVGQPNPNNKAAMM